MSGIVRVGKYDYKNPGSSPSFEGFKNIIIHVKDEGSPYILKDSKGRIMENIWQFSKIYDYVDEQKQTIHRYTSEPGWT